MGLPKSAYELQTLFGMGDAIQKVLVERGHRVRVYTPYGAILPGMAYLVRRLLENTSNESFLKASLAEKAPVDVLLRDPEEIGAMLTLKRRTEGRDLSRARHRCRCRRFGTSRRSISLGPRTARRCGRRSSRCGCNWGGRIRSPSAATRSTPRAAGSIRSTRATARGSWARLRWPMSSTRKRPSPRPARRFPAWSATPAQKRAAVLIEAARIMRNRRFELAAWEVFECGKPWAEADGDIAEAIDFCEFYAREMCRLAEPRHRDASGETNYTEPIARGVAVVIPPWNFPLAIPTGMTVAALVTGNTVVLKPAEQSPVIAWHLAQILDRGRASARRAQLSSGPGEEAGQALVNHPEVDLIAFTGSRDVGLLINRQAAAVAPGQDHVKRVIAEMGGKNAILIDDDADLDEAVVGVIQSAFGYAGQKCSACSRVIVLAENYDAFLARLIEAARAVKIGPADDPETVVGPVIDAQARSRILEYQRIAAAEGRVVFQARPGRAREPGVLRRPDDRRRREPARPRRAGRDLRPRAGRLEGNRPDDALRIADGNAVRLDRRPLFTQPGQHRKGQARVPRRQPLHQPRHHRRPRRPPAVRRLQALRHRHQGRRPRLPARIPAHPLRHRKHHAPRVCTGGSGRRAVHLDVSKRRPFMSSRQGQAGRNLAAQCLRRSQPARHAAPRPQQRMPPAITEIDQQPEHQPDRQANPVLPAEREHHEPVDQNAHRAKRTGSTVHGTDAASPGRSSSVIQTAPETMMNANRVPMLTRSARNASGAKRRRGRHDDAHHDRRLPRRLEPRMNGSEDSLRQQAVAGHRQQDPRLAEIADQERAGHARQDPDRDQPAGKRQVLGSERPQPAAHRTSIRR